MAAVAGRRLSEGLGITLRAGLPCVVRRTRLRAARGPLLRWSMRCDAHTPGQHPQNPGARCCVKKRREMRALYARGWFVALAVGACAAAVAEPVHYQESIGGDLQQGSPSTWTRFALDVGESTISGRAGNVLMTPDWDPFAFTVPSGSQLLTIQVDLSDVEGNSVSSTWLLQSIIGVTTLQTMEALSPGSANYSGPALTSGLYWMQHTLHGYGIASDTNTFDYTFTLTVSPVPEPPASILAAFGVAGLCLIRRLTDRSVRL